ncbi:hypothetical protein ACFY0G_00880 [Streptomyces sp. NPDC001552]|uniref:hypothetical protein n=1 Tax=Streptomyces sp. NPDC001552 TaxID=3364587 RepID=UPI0036C7BABF
MKRRRSLGSHARALAALVAGLLLLGAPSAFPVSRDGAGGPTALPGRPGRLGAAGALFQCQDAGFLNTGVGLGYNTYANPFVCRPADRQSVRERYTGREFILPNALFTALPSRVDIPLDLGAPGQRDFLHTGYCR